MFLSNVGQVQPAAENNYYAHQEQTRLEQIHTEPKAKPQVQSAASDIEQIGLIFNKKLKFVIDHSSNDVIVKVIDKETDKVIKELPPEELQRMHNDLKETIGFLFDERV